MTFTLVRQHHEFDDMLDALAALSADEEVDIHMTVEEFTEYCAREFIQR